MAGTHRPYLPCVFYHIPALLYVVQPEGVKEIEPLLFLSCLDTEQYRELILCTVKEIKTFMQ